MVLLAESGLGKTRLAQRFYDSLVALEQDDGGYWPPSLGSDGNNLLVNPTADEFDGAAPLPFLWWGVRLADPQGHNQVTTGSLAAHVDQFLVPHLGAFHREQRRRQRLLKLAKVGGAVAADAVLDLVPFLGLLKKVGEVGMELKGIHDSWRQDRLAVDPAAVLEQRRDSLVDQLMTDLEKLFTGPAGRRVPAVIFIDDAQFSAFDPGVTAFLTALVPAMTAGRWPVLLLVTHWEREYVAGTEADGARHGAAQGSVAHGSVAQDASPVAAIIDEHSRQELDSVRVIRLTPIEGLEPLVSARLPGLTAAQVERLTERAGGNPQFLEEIVRVAFDPRNRGLFEGRSTSNAMTEQGIETLLAKSVRLHDVVAERFSSSPESVQKAVSLAGMQGAQFLRTLVGDAAAVLEPEAAGPAGMASALEDAERRHAYIASLDDEQVAFSQRIYQDVAREFLPAFFDEEEATSALRGVVADIIHGRRVHEFERDATMALWRLGVSLFEGSDDVEERRMAVHCLSMVLGAARESGELQVAHRLALRQAALLETLPDANLDGDLLWLRAVNLALSDVGDLDGRRPVLTRLVQLTGESFGADVNVWTASMYVQTLLDVAEFHEQAGDEPARAEVLGVAVDVMASIDGYDEDIGALEASLRLHRMYGEWLVERGEPERAAEVQSHAHAIASRLTELDDAPTRRYDLAVVERQVGRTALMREDRETAAASLSRAIDNLRELMTSNTSVTLEIQLASTLDDLAETYTGDGRHAEAETLLVEGLELMKRHLTLAPEAARTRNNLADSLERVAAVRGALGNLDSAWTLSREAIDLRRAILDQMGTGPAAADLGLTLSRAAEVAARRQSVDEGYGPAREGLALLREARQRDDSIRASWRVLFAIRVLLPFETARAGLAAARALLHEADGLYAAVAPESAHAFRFQMSAIARQRAVVLESDGDHLGATRARARAAELVAGPVDATAHGIN